MNTDRSRALAVAKQGFQAAMRRAKYSGMIGQAHYRMDRDDWKMHVISAAGSKYTFPIAKSWEP